MAALAVVFDRPVFQKRDLLAAYGVDGEGGGVAEVEVDLLAGLGGDGDEKVGGGHGVLPGLGWKGRGASVCRFCDSAAGNGSMFTRG